MKRYPSTRSSAHYILGLFSGLALAASLALPLPALSATVALATSPLANSTTSSVSPNLMFLLDDSGSMDWDYMPDPTKNFAGDYGYNTSQCNGVYYNPSITYTPPVTSTGSSYTNSTFTSAEVDGYDTGDINVNLDTGFTGASGSGDSGYDTYSGPAFYYVYSGDQDTEAERDYYDTNSVFYKECNSAIGTTTAHDGTHPVNTLFAKRTLHSTEATNLTINSSTASGTFTITVSGGSSTPVSSITVGGTTITSGASTGSSTDSTEASNLRSKITQNGYSATVSGTVITVTGPATVGASVVVTKSSGSDTFTVSAITPVSVVSGITVNGVQLMLSGSAILSSTTSTTATDIAAKINATGYSAKANTFTIAVSGSSSTSVSGITVNGVQLMSGTSTADDDSDDVAANVAAKITLNGYSALASGSTITIFSPDSADYYAPVITKSGTMTFTPALRPVVTIAGPASATNYTPVITHTGTLTYTVEPFPDTTAAKLTNFANWYTYYSNRMLMMKTGVGQAFAEITDKYRVGYITLNNNNYDGSHANTADMVDLASFDATQKAAWYAKLYAASPGDSTPLREALSKVGRLYAAKYSPTTIYTSTITVSGGGSTSVTHITVNGVEIMAGATSSKSDNGDVANRIAGKINEHELYDASYSGSVVTITGTAADNGHAPVVSQSGSKTFTVTVFAPTIIPASLNGIQPLDPIQYSCQQNFLILSTDGFWNGNAGYQLDGSTAIGNQDGLVPRPMYDGAAITQTTTQLRRTQTQIFKSTVQAQKQTLQVQQKTSSLQSSTSNLQTSTFNLQSSTSTVQQQTSQLQRRTSTVRFATGQLQTRTRACGSGCSWSSWTNVAAGDSCQWDNTYPNKRECKYDTLSAYADVAAGSTCTSNDQSANTTEGNTWTGNRVSCQYAAWSAWANAGSCTAAAQSGSSPYSHAVGCQTVVTSAYANVPSCIVTTPDGSGVSTQCRYSAYSTPANAGSCTYQGQSGTFAGPALTCSYGTSPTLATVTSCTPVAKTTSTANGTVWDPTAHDCVYAAYSTPANAGSCTTVARSGGSPYAGPAVNCSYTAYTGWTNASSCTIVARSPDPGPYTVGTAYDCQTTDTGIVPAISCVDGVTGGQTVICYPSVTTGPTAVASCTNGTSACTAPLTSASCITTSCATTTNGPTLVASCTAEAASSSNSYVATTCSPTSSSVAAESCTPQTASAGNGYTTISCSASGGTSDTLADTAMYYYQTDLRNSSLSNCTGGASTDFPSGNDDVCTDNVFVSGDDNNVKQHMTTFTLGLGARGRMVFSPDYPDQTSGDFHSIKTGATAAAGPPEICSWQSSGACNWSVPAEPAPGVAKPENIDDTWHAAVNGRGTYFSATDPASLSAGLSGALSSITARKGAAAAAATSTLNPVPGNNLAYLASYTTVKWTGNLEARSINVDTGEISLTDTWCVENVNEGTCSAPSSIVIDSSGSSVVYNCVTPDTTGTSCTGTWDGVAQCTVPMPTACVGTLPDMVSSASDTRTIKTPSSDGTDLDDFLYSALDTTNRAYFAAAHINTLSQWTSLTGDQQTAAAGENLVNFLRGQTGYERDRTINPAGNRIYRFREAVLGDVLESQPFFIGPPVFGYADPGYAEFKTGHADRPGTVYVGANDGMLHAFAAKNDTAPSPDDVGGKERWAFVPSMVIPNMWKLADASYDIHHTNFINGSVNVADICTDNCTDTETAVWKTILVGGLSGGGKGYYALDVTDPTSPALLWEFTTADDANLGYSFGNPVITKLNSVDNGINNGAWVVLVTSGYNNVGDGQGYLYVLDAATGAIIKTIPTGVGSTTTPSGLSRIAAWNDVPAGNQAGYTYGGDLLGNVWRFDINSDAEAGVNPMLFATLSDPSGVRQPVTTIPVLGTIAGKRVIFIGTGKYLEASDLSTTQVQSVYAIMDDDATTTLVNPRTTLTEQTLELEADTTNSRIGSENDVEFTADHRGWYVDFPPDSLLDPNPDIGERVNIDMSLISGTLLVPTIVPSNTVCSPGGFGWFNYFDYRTGGLVSTSDRFNSGIVGYNVIYLHGEPILKVVLSSGEFVDPPDQPIPAGSATGFNATRAVWRELLQ